MIERCCKTARPKWRRRQSAMLELLRHAKVVTDPNKLAFLNTELANRKQLRASRRAHTDSVLGSRSLR
jgi:hypothetical protein